MEIKNSGFSFVKVTSLVFYCLFFSGNTSSLCLSTLKTLSPTNPLREKCSNTEYHPSTGKCGPEKNSVFGHFLRSDLFLVSCVKFQEHLGIYLDEKLNFNYHISHANWKSSDKWLFSCFKSILKVLHSNYF